jgi:hypothetical protein
MSIVLYKYLLMKLKKECIINIYKYYQIFNISTTKKTNKIYTEE